jgi:GT2 family glycosyltransferase
MKLLPKVSIIILNWNGWMDTIECLESLFKISYQNYNIIVIDNGSEDDSIIKIKKYCEGQIEIRSSYFEYSSNNKPIDYVEYSYSESGPYLDTETIQSDRFPNTKIILIKNGKNYGFTEGNNIGLRYAEKLFGPNYILFLNNDTVVDYEFLNELIYVGEQDQKIGFIGPKVFYYNNPPEKNSPLENISGKNNIIQSAGCLENIWIFESKSIGDRELDSCQYDLDKEVDFIQGSCMLVKTNMIHEIGYFDKNFFSYKEENDWGLRGHKFGWKSVFAYRSKIWHKGGGSQKFGNGKYRSVAIFYPIRNRFLLAKKHGDFLQKVTFSIYFFGFNFWFLSAIYLVYHKGDFASFNSVLKGTIDGLKILLGKKAL